MTRKRASRKSGEEHYLVCTIKPWHIKQYRLYSKKLPGHWHLITDKDELTQQRIAAINPRYIFFPHWSWIVPAPIVEQYECVCFHETDLPYGRGGSPIQNLIIRGHKTTKITALRMTDELDAGPVYLKKPLSLKGSAQEIFDATANIIPQMIAQIIKSKPVPVAQRGKAVQFKRRTEEEGQLPKGETLEHSFNLIRMLDADTYPKAYIQHGNLLLKLSDAKLAKGKITASVEIIMKDSK